MICPRTLSKLLGWKETGTQVFLFHIQHLTTPTYTSLCAPQNWIIRKPWPLVDFAKCINLPFVWHWLLVIALSHLFGFKIAAFNTHTCHAHTERDTHTQNYKLSPNKLPGDIFHSFLHKLITSYLRKGPMINVTMIYVIYVACRNRIIWFSFLVNLSLRYLHARWLKISRLTIHYESSWLCPKPRKKQDEWRRSLLYSNPSPGPVAVNTSVLRCSPDPSSPIGQAEVFLSKGKTVLIWGDIQPVSN